ncbi:hypothetical protein [Micromonospora sp. NPDC049679]|uniref:hypothetical protein n=1 Tax=Micromonospora sp. NPDC049679 TaxID=3155920 RepID=UPI0033E622D8
MDLERLLDKPVLKHLRSGVATIRAIMFVGSVLGSGLALIVLAARYFSVSWKLATALSVLLILLLSVSGYAWRYVTRVYDPAFYEIVDLEGLLVVEPLGDHRRYTYTRSQTVKATRDDLRLVEFRAHWTGKGHNGTSRVESLIPEHAILDGRRAESDGRVHRWIYPRRPLERGKALRVGIRQVHEDDVEIQLPYFREGGGRYKTGKITVIVKLPFSEHSPESVRGVVWNSNRTPRKGAVVDELPIPTPRVDSAAGTAEYRVTVEKPSPYHSYGVEWTWLREPPD